MCSENESRTYGKRQLSMRRFITRCCKRSGDLLHWNRPETPLLIPLLDLTKGINNENLTVSETSLLGAKEVENKALKVKV